MAAYSYKEVMNRPDFDAAIAPAMEAVFKTAKDFDGDANYDGDGWIVAAFLLDQKDAQLAAAEQEHARLAAVLVEARETLIRAIRANVDLADFDPAEHGMVQKIDAALSRSGEPQT